MHSTSQPSELTLSSFLPPNITELPKYYWIIVVMSYSCPIWQFEKVDAVERTVVVPAMPLSQVGVLDDRGQLPGTNFSLDIFLCSYTGTQNLLLVFYHNDVSFGVAGDILASFWWVCGINPCHYSSVRNNTGSKNHLRRKKKKLVTVSLQQQCEKNQIINGQH